VHPVTNDFLAVKSGLEPLGKAGGAFTIYGASRNARGKRGCGALGYRNSEIIHWYERELAWTYQFLIGEMGLKRPAAMPIDVYVCETGEIREFAYDPSPQTFLEIRDRRSRISIALPSRSSFPNPEEERAYLRAAAVHEATHAVCFGQPQLRTISDNLLWIGEAVAEWLAFRRLCDQEPSYIRSLEYALDWCDYPQIPMNAAEGWYSAFLFVEYLVRRAGERTVVEMWKTFTADKDPWEAITAIGGAGIFAEFCRDAYFLNDSKGGFHCPQVYGRFGPRAWHSSHEVEADEWVEGMVADFACRYYALHPAGGSASIDFDFETDAEELRVSLAGSTADYHRTGDYMAVTKGGARIDLSQFPGYDHLVLIVSNQPGRSYPESSRRHRFRFRLGRQPVSE
jgi:hypothetical protein